MPLIASDNRLAVGSWNGHVYLYANELVEAVDSHEAIHEAVLRPAAYEAHALLARRHVRQETMLIINRCPLSDATPRVYSLALTQVWLDCT